MKIYKNIEFHKWSKKQSLKDECLINAVRELNKGLYDASLGGGVYKKRIALKNKGKRGGIRTILAFQINKKVFFIYGFSKNKLGNITKNEEIALKKLARIYFSFTQIEIDIALKSGELIEVRDEKIHIKSSS